MQLVTVYTSFSPAEAQLIRSRLEAASFHALVKNELSALSMDGYAMTVGGVQVQVPEDEAADARELLAAADPDPGPTEPAPPVSNP